MTNMSDSCKVWPKIVASNLFPAAVSAAISS